MPASRLPLRLSAAKSPLFLHPRLLRLHLYSLTNRLWLQFRCRQHLLPRLSSLLIHIVLLYHRRRRRRHHHNRHHLRLVLHRRFHLLLLFLLLFLRQFLLCIEDRNLSEAASATRKVPLALIAVAMGSRWTAGSARKRFYAARRGFRSISSITCSTATIASRATCASNSDLKPLRGVGSGSWRMRTRQ